MSLNIKIHLKQHGISLIVVLWLLVIMTVMVLSFSHGVRTEILLASNYRNQTQALASAEAGIWRGIAMILNKGAAKAKGQHIKLDGSVYSLHAGLHISMQSNNGLIDLNRASSEMVKKLLSTLITDPIRIDTITDSLLDWRDEDDLKRLFGAESDDYAALGLNYGAKNGLMNSIDELARVNGVDQTLFSLLSPLVTVYSGQPRIAIISAPKKVLLALPGMNAELANSIMMARNTGNINLDLIPSEARNFIGAGQDEYIRISAIATVNNAISGIIAEIQFIASHNSPVTIVSWRQEIDGVF